MSLFRQVDCALTFRVVLALEHVVQYKTFKLSWGNYNCMVAGLVAALLYKA